MKDELGSTYDKLEASLKDIHRQIGNVKPRAILMVSAHWETPGGEVAIMSSPRPSMVYDYYGFPRHTYSIKYEAPGDPDVAKRVLDLLQNAGIKSKIDRY